MTATVLGVIALSAYSDALQNRQLRARQVVIEPGGRIAVHPHDRRPALVYVIEGGFIEHRRDSTDPVVRRQGDAYFEGPDVVHWSENVSPTRVRAFAVDILPRDPE